MGSDCHNNPIRILMKNVSLEMNWGVEIAIVYGMHGFPSLWGVIVPKLPVYDGRVWINRAEL